MQDARYLSNPTSGASRSVVEYDDIRKVEDILLYDLSFRGLLRP